MGAVPEVVKMSPADGEAVRTAPADGGAAEMTPPAAEMASAKTSPAEMASGKASPAEVAPAKPSAANMPPPTTPGHGHQLGTRQSSSGIDQERCLVVCLLPRNGIAGACRRDPYDGGQGSGRQASAYHGLFPPLV
jgi:hypothetical protein